MGRASEADKFAFRLRQVRAVYGASIGKPDLSQAEFAELLDLKEITVRKYEAADRWPSMQVLSAIRKLTGISLDYLVCGLRAGITDLAAPGSVEATPGARLAWARELLEPSIEKIAHVMRVTPDKWQRIEDAAVPLPIAIAVDVVRRFGVSLDYLYLGVMSGVEPKLGAELRRRHPELAAALETGPTSGTALPAPASAASNRRPRRAYNRSR